MKVAKYIVYLVCFFISVNNSLFGQTSFINVTDDSYINHKHVAPNLIGGGAAVIDYNNDGFEDIYFTGGVYEDHLFKNNGDKTFTDVSGDFDIYNQTREIQTMGVISGDINNDGFDDLFITTESGEKNILFLNNKGESLENISMQAGFLDESWSMGASFGDYNLDGYLDIYVINYIKKLGVILDENNEAIGFNHECYPNHFYLNQGNNTFLEMAEELEVNNEGCGLAVAITDVNGDNFSDIYIANDFGEWIEPNTYYQNNYPDNNFSNYSKLSQLDVPMYGMGLGIGDINNDGLLDYYVTNLGKNALLKQKNDQTFENITSLAGVGNEMIGEFNSTGWGTEIFDYDHDGYEDIFVSNGFIAAAPFLKTTLKDPNKLYKNKGNSEFTDVTELEDLDDDAIGRGVVTIDYDNDGDLDVLVVNIYSVLEGGSGVQLLENTIGNQRNWLKIKLNGKKSNLDGIGAKIVCYYEGAIWIDEVSGGASHASKKSNFAHFGLKEIIVLDSLEVIWPGGYRQVFLDVNTNQFLSINENSSSFDVLGCMELDNILYNSNATLSTGCFTNNTLTNINNQIQKNNIVVYPNPTSKNLQISFEHLETQEVLIYNELSQIVLSNKIRSMQKLDVSGLNTGIYFVKVGKYFREKIKIVN